MRSASPSKLPLLLHPLLAAALAGVCLSASADSAINRAREQGKLVAGIDHVMPAYVAGTKFRTPESIDAALAQDLARRLRIKLALAPVDRTQRARTLAEGRADILLAPIGEHDPLHQTATVIPTGYAAGPMAIMRTDTDIKSWEQLKGRSVCLTEGGQYAGRMAAQYGAVEQVYKAPADALLAVRTGKCDAAVHDDVLLEELLKLPEWKKFSARLPAGPRAPLSLIVPANDAKARTYLKSVASEWQSKGYLTQLVNKAARSIAFEVYLDQDVPDCH